MSTTGMSRSGRNATWTMTSPMMILDLIADRRSCEIATSSPGRLRSDRDVGLDSQSPARGKRTALSAAGLISASVCMHMRAHVACNAVQACDRSEHHQCLYIALLLLIHLFFLNFTHSYTIPVHQDPSPVRDAACQDRAEVSFHQAVHYEDHC